MLLGTSPRFSTGDCTAYDLSLSKPAIELVQAARVACLVLSNSSIAGRHHGSYLACSLELQNAAYHIQASQQPLCESSFTNLDSLGSWALDLLGLLLLRVRRASLRKQAVLLQLHVQLGGQAVFNSPLSFSLRPGPVSLDRLTVRGVTSACTAGKTRAVTICALDAYGHATALDGTAVIMMQIASGADIVDGEPDSSLLPCSASACTQSVVLQRSGHQIAFHVCNHSCCRCVCSGMHVQALAFIAFLVI